MKRFIIFVRLFSNFNYEEIEVKDTNELEAVQKAINIMRNKGMNDIQEIHCYHTQKVRKLKSK